MNLNEPTMALFHYFLDTLNGAVWLFLLTGVSFTRQNIRLTIFTVGLCFSAVAAAILMRGLDHFSLIYALCVHLPFVLFFTFGLHRPFSSTLMAHILTYFMGAPRFVLGYLSVFLFKRFDLPLDDMTAMRIGWAITVPLLFWPIYKFLIPPLRGLIRYSSSERPYLLAILGSCYVFSQALFGLMSQNLWSQLFLLFFIAFLVSLVGYSRKLQELKESNERMVAYSVKNEALAFYTESLTGYLQDTARLRHDHRHFLTLLDMYADQGDLQTIRDLIGDNLAALGASPARVTGSDVVDAIITLFRKKAEEFGVSIKITGKGLLSLPLPENDLCLLLSNGLENAINAAHLAETGKRSVILSISRNDANGTACLIIRNPCPNNPAFSDDGLPLSARGKGHGYGTSSMRTIVTKNGGLCDFSVENSEFVFRAAFLPRKNAETGGGFTSKPRLDPVAVDSLSRVATPREIG